MLVPTGLFGRAGPARAGIGCEAGRLPADEPREPLPLDVPGSVPGFCVGACCCVCPPARGRDLDVGANGLDGTRGTGKAIGAGRCAGTEDSGNGGS